MFDKMTDTKFSKVREFIVECIKNKIITIPFDNSNIESKYNSMLANHSDVIEKIPPLESFQLTIDNHNSNYSQKVSHWALVFKKNVENGVLHVCKLDLTEIFVVVKQESNGFTDIKAGSYNELVNEFNLNKHLTYTVN
jgi:hypothetical protein